MSDFLDQKKQKNETSWLNSYEHLSKIINDLNLKTGAELGVAFGGHSEHILKNTNVKKLYGIDQYQHDKKYHDGMNIPQEEFDKLHKQVLDRMAVFGERFQLIRKPSTEAILDIKENLDFVYIDADHSLKGVWNDLLKWYDKVNIDGIISGHDYASNVHPNVKIAVDTFFQVFNKEVVYCGDGVWYTRKTEEMTPRNRIKLFKNYLKIRHLR